MHTMLFSTISLLLGALQLRLIAGATTITQWQVTQYNIEILTTSVATYETGLTFTETATLELIPPFPTSLIPSASPTSTTTDADADLNLNQITQFYPAASVSPAQLSAIQSYLSAETAGPTTTSETFTSFVISTTYTASTCSPTFKITTTSNIYVPIGAETQLPTGTSSSSSTYSNHVYITIFLPPDVVVPTSTSSDYIQRYYLASCSSPASIPTGLSSGSSSSDPYNNDYPYGPDNSYDDNANCLGSLCPFWLIYIIVIIPIWGFLIIGGLFESYFWFQRFMKGKFALRGVPLLWVAFSLWTLLCLRRKRPAPQNLRPELEQQWRAMSFGQHVRLWLKYGFRHRDPPEFTRIVGASAPMATGWGPAPGGR